VAVVLMNRVETAVVNSPPRRWLQRGEARLLRRLGGPVAAGRVLELGCGRGFGTRLIPDRFGVREVDALDLDPRMVTRARITPGGRFYFDEITAAALATRGYRWLFEHPTEDRFTGAEFVAGLERQGLHVGPRRRTYLRGHDLIGVSERPALAGETR
jgi:SAM-dependent methyltransferase